MKSYYRVMLGKNSAYAEEAKGGNFVGVDFISDINLSKRLPNNWRDFNKEFIPIFLERHIDKTKVAAGLACGMLYTLAKGMLVGDIVLCPDGSGSYFVGEIVSDYIYQKGGNLPHRRQVNWYPNKIDRSLMTQELKYSTGAAGTVVDISRHSSEIDRFIAGDRPSTIVTTDETIEDPNTFALEKHLEDFLVQNWKSTELGKHYDIYEEDGEIIGQQYQADSDFIDILAISKNKKELLVVELKRGRASYVVVGQIQNYMGYVKEILAEKDQTVKGVIIALEDDLRLKRALSVTQNIDFYTYKVSFKLEKK